MHNGFLKAGLLSFGAGILLGLAYVAFDSYERGPAAPLLSFSTPASEHGDTPPDVANLAPAALMPFIEMTGSCGPHYEGECAVARSAPTTTARVLERLRTGVVLPVATTTITDASGRRWHEVVFREWIRYPSRVSSAWYVAEDYARPFEAEEDLTTHATTSKRIVVDRSEQKLYAYEGDELFMETAISTGLDLTPTPRGVFSVFRKTPSRYMQGPLPGISNQYYDLPGVPWNLYFTLEGGAIHGAYWHEEFGKQRSHGCVNLPLTEAQKLYEWTPIGTEVLVRD